MSIAVTEKRLPEDRGRFLGGGLMLAFAGIAFGRWSTSGEIFFLLLFFRDLLAGIFFFIRISAKEEGTNFHRNLAYVSASLPLFYLNSADIGTTMEIACRLFSIGGFLLATLATIELGTRIAIAPSKRGDLCKTGVYKVLRHPMYLGYSVAEFGMVLLNPLNILLYAISLGLYWTRAKWENILLSRSGNLTI